MKRFNTFLGSLMHRKKWSFCFVFILCSNILFSQQNLLLKADAAFEEGRYNEAIPIYTKAYEKDKNKSILLKLSDSHYLNENYPQAQKYYEEYFSDTIFENIPQFANYANATKASGKFELAVQLYHKLYEATANDSIKINYDRYQFYLDNLDKVRVYDLDADYNCVSIDASESIDTLAAPVFYLWDFGDGKTAEGLIVDHCFKQSGEHPVVLSIRDRATGYTRANDTTIIILTETPPIKFEAPPTAKRYFYVKFDASKADIPGYTITDYIWNMDDGSIQQGKNIQYKFNLSRDFRIQLTVIAKSKYTNNIEIFSASKKIEIKENYETPSKKFTDILDGAK